MVMSVHKWQGTRAGNPDPEYLQLFRSPSASRAYGSRYVWVGATLGVPGMLGSLARWE